MASIFDVFKTFRPRRTIMSEDFNGLQTALKAAFDKIGTEPPSGKTGVGSAFHCSDPTDTQHAVTLGYFQSEANAAFAPNIEKARQWAEQTADTDVNGITGARSALHWSGVAEYWAQEAEAVVFSDAATPAQGARADEAHGWGDHALAGYAESDTAESFTSITLGTWTITDSAGKLTFSNGSVQFSLDASGNIVAAGDVTASGTP